VIFGTVIFGTVFTSYIWYCYCSSM